MHVSMNSIHKIYPKSNIWFRALGYYSKCRVKIFNYGWSFRLLLYVKIQVYSLLKLV